MMTQCMIAKETFHGHVTPECVFIYFLKHIELDDAEIEDDLSIFFEAVFFLLIYECSFCLSNF